MTNDEDSGGGKTSGDSSASAVAGKKKDVEGHPNGDASFGNGSGGVDSTGSKSDEFDDHVPLETDALQPKMVKSKSSNKVKESKEVNILIRHCYISQVYLILNSSIITPWLSILMVAHGYCFINPGTRTGNMESKSRIFVSCHRICGRFGKCLAISIYLLSKRWR